MKFTVLFLAPKYWVTNPSVSVVIGVSMGHLQLKLDSSGLESLKKTKTLHGSSPLLCVWLPSELACHGKTRFCHSLSLICHPSTLLAETRFFRREHKATVPQPRVTESADDFPFSAAEAMEKDEGTGGLGPRSPRGTWELCVCSECWLSCLRPYHPERAWSCLNAGCQTVVGLSGYFLVSF